MAEMAEVPSEYCYEIHQETKRYERPTDKVAGMHFAENDPLDMLITPILNASLAD